MKIRHIILAGAFFGLIASAEPAEKSKAVPAPSIALHLLASGEDNTIAYTLYHVPSKEKELDLVLIIRNTGAKWVDADGVGASLFTFSNDKGIPLKIWRATGMDGIAYQNIVVAHIYVQGPVSNDKDYTLELRPKPKAFVPIKFKTTPFRLQKKKDKKDSPTRQSTATD